MKFEGNQNNTTTQRRLRRHTAASVMVAIALLTACSTSGGSKEANGPGGSDPTNGPTTTTTPPPQRLTDADKAGQWTVFVYLAADNNLEDQAIADMEEMSETAGTEFVVLLDRTPDYVDTPLFDFGDFDDAGIFHIKDGAVDLVEPMGELNMGDPTVLEEFIVSGLADYKNDHNALMLWDHGGAWKGVAWDDSSDHDNITLAELADALEAGLATAGEDAFDLIGFDACLMATYEVATAIAPHAAYMVASEEVEPGAGWDWTTINTPAAGLNTVDFATQIVEGYTAQSSAKGENATTLSLVDVTKMEALDAAVAMTADAIEGDGADVIGRIGWARTDSVGFSRHPDPTVDYFMVDLGHLAEQLSAVDATAEAAEALAAAIDQAVVLSEAGPAFNQATGLAAYFPTSEEYHRPAYDELGIDNPWQDVLTAYYETAARVDEVDLPYYLDEDRFLEDADVDYDAAALGVIADVEADKGGNITKALLQWGRVDVDDPTWTLWFGERNAVVDGDTVSADYDWRYMVIGDGRTKAISYTALHYDTAGELDLMTIPILYTSGGEDYEGMIQLSVIDDEISAQTFYLQLNGSVSAINPYPNDTFIPLLKRQNLVDFSVEWVKTLTLPVDADADLDYDYGRLPANGAVMVGLGYETIGDTEDWVYHGNATPAEG